MIIPNTISFVLNSQLAGMIKYGMYTILKTKVEIRMTYVTLNFKEQLCQFVAFKNFEAESLYLNKFRREYNLNKIILINLFCSRLLYRRE